MPTKRRNCYIYSIKDLDYKNNFNNNHHFSNYLLSLLEAVKIAPAIHQLLECALLHYRTLVEHDYLVRVLYRLYSVSYRYARLAPHQTI